ncbi:hypothetical protein SISNIDRAFT_299055 [Sistotremastrum niveocremeum HHB9708]|uniref:Uncharacterized protein n=1 Tax=Sistotremastrum niveocremeum HHB9708 TaxID=1314777 RepID=A0A164NE95_9AGAM|nr:hypothetical protein SISNIDRAFT_299055 [Sistotremastrum niveocremeum HHB9708]
MLRISTGPLRQSNRPNSSQPRRNKSPPPPKTTSPPPHTHPPLHVPLQKIPSRSESSSIQRLNRQYRIRMRIKIFRRYSRELYDPKHGLVGLTGPNKSINYMYSIRSSRSRSSYQRSLSRVRHPSHILYIYMGLLMGVGKICEDADAG